MEIKKRIEEIATPFFDQIGAYIVEIQVVPNEQRKIVQLFVDTDIGITIDQCADLSRELGKAIELHGVLPNSYVLQISSPGLTKPLKLFRQYRKNIGRKFKVRYRKDSEVVEIVARLDCIEKEILTFSTDRNEKHVIPFIDIIESIEELPW